MGGVKFNYGRYYISINDGDRWISVLEEVGMTISRKLIGNNKYFSEEGEVSENGCKLVYSLRHPDNGLIQLGFHPSKWESGEEVLAIRINNYLVKAGVIK